MTNGISHTEVVAAVRAGMRGAEAASAFGVSRERIRQIFTKETGERLPKVGASCRVCGDRFYDGRPAHVVEKHPEYLWAKRVRRFWARVEKTETCWLWRGAVNPATGYGNVDLVGEQYAHRVSYTLVIGPIPDGLTIDHLCRVHDCVNPDHLEAVTQRENTLRSPTAVAAINARKTSCPRGHPYDAVTSRGYRRCRRCDNARQRDFQRRRASERQESVS